MEIRGMLGYRPGRDLLFWASLARFFAVIVALAYFPVEIPAQGTTTAYRIRHGPTLPATCSALNGDVFVDTSPLPSVVYWCTQANTWTAFGNAGVGIVTLNGQTGATQDFSIGTGGTDFNVQSVGNTHFFNLPDASALHRGALTTIDWSAFNAKQPAGNYISALTGDVTAAGPGSVAATLANTAVSAGSYGDASHVASFTADAKGRLTAAANVAIALDASAITSGTMAAARLGSGSGGSTKFLREDSTWQTVSSGSGTVTSVGLALPANFTVTGSPVTTSGTLTATMPDEAQVTSPLDISGCVAWYRAESLGLTDGDAVATWTDLSGAGNDAVQATAANKPIYKAGVINNHAALLFDAGAAQRMKTAAGIIGTTAARTLIVAYRKIDYTGTSARTVAGEGSVNAANVQFYIQDRPDINLAAPYLLLGTSDIASGYNEGSTSGLKQQWKIVAASYGGGVGGATKIFVGAVLGNQSVATLVVATDGLRVGYNPSNEYMHGYIAELIYYDSALSTANVMKVMWYLSHQYGIRFW